MNKLNSLERKRNSLRSYHTGVFITGALMLGLLYLLAAIPKLDPSETDLEMFMSLQFEGIIGVICAAICFDAGCRYFLHHSRFLAEV